MAITFVAADFAVGTAAPRPSGALAGHFAVATGLSGTPVAGWTRVEPDGGSAGYGVYSRIYDGTSTDTLPAIFSNGCVLSVWSGALAVEDSLTSQGQHNYGLPPGVSNTLLGRTASKSNSVYLWHARDNWPITGQSGAQSPIAPVTARHQEVVAGALGYVASVDLSSAGPTGTFTQRFVSGETPGGTIPEAFFMILVPAAPLTPYVPAVMV